jgi:regulator of cell morphogenesis and NO signaling
MSSPTQSIREIVRTHPSTARIFHRFDIDLCSEGDRSLAEACADQQLSLDQVLEKLADAEAEETGSSSFDPAALSLGKLIQHVVRVHHHCIRQELPRLAEMARKLAIKRRDQIPDLERIAELIEQLRGDLFAHIKKEEETLFPFIAQMDQDSIVAYPPAHACFRSVEQPVSKMVQQHEDASHIVFELYRLTGGFVPPTSACATHFALLDGLRAFTTDLKEHVHTENDLLFPRAIEMEAVLNSRR